MSEVVVVELTSSFVYSVGTQSDQGLICRASGRGQSSLSHNETSRFDGWLTHRHGCKQNEDRRSSIIAEAVPTGVTAVAALLAVGGSLYALLQLNKDKLETWQARKDCEVCSGWRESGTTVKLVKEQGCARTVRDGAGCSSRLD
ncbi:hypothetical protein R1sor_003702 [Riccia sorocarpa]|uniref:Uncharacterized protein n=1 Tax=Riccia sorocarpa TaxID=122646 RepID=A0ABD3H2D5_9MARC